MKLIHKILNILKKKNHGIGILVEELKKIIFKDIHLIDKFKENKVLLDLHQKIQIKLNFLKDNHLHNNHKVMYNLEVHHIEKLQQNQQPLLIINLLDQIHLLIKIQQFNNKDHLKQYHNNKHYLIYYLNIKEILIIVDLIMVLL